MRNLLDRSRRAAGFCIGLISLLFGLALAVLLLALRPIRDIRVQEICAQRIGHLALEPEIWLCRQANELRPAPKVFFYAPGPIANHYVLKAWQRLLTVGPTWLLKPIYQAGTRFPALNVRPTNWPNDHHDLRILDQTPTQFRMSKAERDLALQFRRNHSIADDTPHVCLAIRDSAYLETAIPEKQWLYHAYRDSEIDTYVEMSEFLASQGFAVLRMGSIVRKPLNVQHPLVIDYANSDDRSEELDVALFSTCAFCISSSTGMDSLALIFRRPVGVANVPGVGGIRLGETTKLVMTKDVRDSRSDSLLTLDDERRLQAMTFTKTSDYALHDLKLCNNSPADLVEFARDMVDIYRGDFQISDRQKVLEMGILKKIPGGRNYSATSAHFARKWFSERGEGPQ